MKSRTKWTLFTLCAIALAGISACVAPWVLIGVGMTLESAAKEKALIEYKPISLADAVGWKYATPEVVATFIDRGEDVRQTTTFGTGRSQALLRFAAQMPNVEVARLLIRRGAPVDDADLWSCLRNANEPMARMLVDEGATLASPASDPEMHFGEEEIGLELVQAAANGHQIWMIRKLVAQGADARIVNAHGQGLLALALENESMSPAEEQARLDSTTALLELGVDPNATGRDRYSALHWSAYYGKPKEIVALLAGGASIEGPPGQVGVPSPLAVAVERCQPEAVALLLDRGAARDAKTTQGLGLPEGACWTGYPELNRGPKAKIMSLLTAPRRGRPA
ncbi:MAG: hypothetical protein ABI639_00755 [Thermoanaerobaculia bacterium]